MLKLCCLILSGKEGWRSGWELDSEEADLHLLLNHLFSPYQRLKIELIPAYLLHACTKVTFRPTHPAKVCCIGRNSTDACAPDLLLNLTLGMQVSPRPNQWIVRRALGGYIRTFCPLKVVSFTIQKAVLAMAFQSSTLLNVPTMQYRIQIGTDQSQQTSVFLQSCNDQVNFQVDDDECFQIPYFIFDQLPFGRIVFGWIPDDHRPQELKTEFQNFRAEVQDKNELQIAAVNAMRFYNRNYNDTFEIKTKPFPKMHQDSREEFVIVRKQSLATMLALIALFGVALGFGREDR